MSTFTTPEPINAAIVVAGARVRIVASERADTVVRVEPVDGTSKADVKVAEKTKVAFSAGRLSVETVKAGGKDGSVAITVELPAGSRLALDTAWSDVQADGPLGDCRLDVASGQVRLEQVGALRGNLAAGSVEIGHVAGSVDVEGASGGLRMGDVDGAVRYVGATGAVWIGHARSDVTLKGSGGSFDIDRADGNVVAEAAHCPIRVGRMTSGQAGLANAAGGIEVGVAEGTVASVDADSTKGAVRNSLRDLDGADHKLAIHARTRRGDIVIHRVA